MSTRPIHILLVEDNPNDTLLIIRALGAKYAQDIHAVEDGVEALAFLHRQGTYAHAPRPDIVLLDLKLPKKDGSQVLIEMRADSALKAIPVIILTASSPDDTFFRRYAGHANAYIPKLFNLEQFAKVLQGTLDLLLTEPEQRPHSPADLPAQTAN